MRALSRMVPAYPTTTGAGTFDAHRVNEGRASEWAGRVAFEYAP